MDKKRIRSSDINVIAASIVRITTEAPTEPKPLREKNSAAVELGRLGGLKGGKARAENLLLNSARQ